MIFKKISKNKGLRLTAAILLLFSLLFSLASCSGSNIAASINDQGIIRYQETNYLPVDASEHTALVFDSEELLGSVDGLINTSLYTLRYSEKNPALDDENVDFLCTISPEKEKLLYVSERYEFSKEGRSITNVFLQYKNAFIKSIDDEKDFQSAVSLDSIRGEEVSFELDIDESNWVSIYACYNNNPVATVWFGSLAMSDDKLFFVYPNEEGRPLSQLFTNERDINDPKTFEFSGVLIEDKDKIADIQRVIGLS